MKEHLRKYCISSPQGDICLCFMEKYEKLFQTIGAFCLFLSAFSDKLLLHLSIEEQP